MISTLALFSNLLSAGYGAVPPGGKSVVVTAVRDTEDAGPNKYQWRFLWATILSL